MGVYRKDLLETDQIILNKKTRWLSIVGPRRRAEEILTRIGHRCRRARAISLKAELVSPEPLEPALLQILERNLKVITRLAANGSEVSYPRALPHTRLRQLVHMFRQVCVCVCVFRRVLNSGISFECRG